MEKTIGEELWQFTMKFVGVFLIIFFTAIQGLLMYSYFYEICKIHFYATQNPMFTAVSAII